MIFGSRRDQWVRRVAVAAIAMAASITGDVMIANQAQATPSVIEAMRFVRTELARLCNDKRNSKFGELGEDTVRGACQVTIGADRLALQVRLREIGEDAAMGTTPGVSGDLAKRMNFGVNSYFYCSQFGEEEMADLYLSCHFESSLTDAFCAERIISSNDDALRSVSRSRSFARIISIPAVQCEAIRSALNFLGERSQRTTRRDPTRFFGDSSGG